MPAGRPKKPIYELPYMLKQIDKYLQDCNVDGSQYTKAGQKKPLRVPILKECCLKNGWNPIYVDELARENEELSLAIRELIGWKEIILEQGMLYGTIKHGAAIFSLKQLGWRDNTSISISKGEDIEDDELTKSLEEIAKKL
ncbi:MAG: hypothetical protein J6W04_02260 [Bacteroidales bacterium]|nr:hypothetical protein [Bacteroidales bacterium]